MNFRKSPLFRSAFTLVELMIAIAASLVLMAALTRAFMLVGERINMSRANVKLSANIRDISFRLRTELSRVITDTNPLESVAGDSGYLVYHDGPMSTSTGFIFGGVTSSIPGYYPQSRWGDLDDFLSFAVRSPEDSPFIGVIPRGVLEAVRAVETGGTYTVPSNYDPTELVTFQSRYAEIAYWLAPRWSRDDAGNQLFGVSNGDNGDGMLEDGVVLYPDNNGDLWPDEMLLYRRTLLVRPDLNLSSGEIPAGLIDATAFTSIGSNQKVVCFMRPDGKIEPAGYSSAYSSYSPGSWTATPAGNAPNWLIGMARVQQYMDLSVAREFQINNSGISNGIPQSYYGANSIEKLRSPHRRFAHVQIPGSLTVGPPLSAVEGASMPVLALSPPIPRLAAEAAAGTTPSLQGGNLVDKFTMMGFLRPEFCLQGVREGEDIIGTNMLSFDVQAFDPNAPVLAEVGDDGSPGISGRNDNYSGPTDDPLELGTSGSDDRAVTPNDPFFYATFRDPSISDVVARGGFVDLDYAMKAGGALRGLANVATPPGTSVPLSRYTHLASPFSCLDLVSGPPINLRLRDGMMRSGKLIRRTGGGFYIQPTFDTWTDEYESDGLNQVQSASGDAYRGSPAQTLFWAFNSTFQAKGPAHGTDETDPAMNRFLITGDAEGETLPPVQAKLRAIQIQLRAIDPETRQIKQSSVVHDFVR